MIFAWAPESLPTITSLLINLSWAEIINLLLVTSSTNTTAVAFEVWPVTVSPLVNLPNVDSSKRILSPASSNVLAVSLRLEFKTKLLTWPVSDWSKIPSVPSMVSIDNYADSNNW